MICFLHIKSGTKKLSILFSSVTERVQETSVQSQLLWPYWNLAMVLTEPYLHRMRNAKDSSVNQRRCKAQKSRIQWCLQWTHSIKNPHQFRVSYRKIFKHNLKIQLFTSLRFPAFSKLALSYSSHRQPQNSICYDNTLDEYVPWQ